MAKILSRWQGWAPEFRSLLRIVAAILFIQVGTVKLFGYPMVMPSGMPPIQLISEIGLAGILETFGGALLLLGLFTRPVAFILAGEMAVAYFQGHAPHGFWPVVNGGTDAILFCFLWLYFSAAGPGPWSVDTIWRKRHTYTTVPGIIGISASELEEAIERDHSKDTVKTNAQLLLAAMNDWPTGIDDPLLFLFTLQEEIGLPLSYRKVQSYLNKLSPAEDAWKMESLSGVLEMFGNDTSVTLDMLVANIAQHYKVRNLDS